MEANTKTALRKGEWVMIPPYAGPAVNEQVNIELGNADVYQLYCLREDIGQKENLAETHPDKLREMIVTFEKIRGTDYQNVQELELK